MTEGQIFQKARVTAGLTQDEIATKLGFKSPQFISNVERNKALFPKQHLKKVAKLVGEKPIKTMIAVRANSYRKELLAELK